MAVEQDFAEIFATRLKEAVRLAGGTDRVGATTGWAQSTFYSWYNLKNSPTVDKVLRICSMAGVKPSWLFGADDEGILTNDRMRSIPIFNIAASAGGGAIAEDEAPVGRISFPIDFLQALGNTNELRLISVRGDSMAPELQDGDQVIFDQSQAQLQEAMIVARLGDALLVKRLRLTGGKDVELVSTNPAYPPTRIALDDPTFAIVGRVVKILKRP